jgi:gag-polypeptide of LTR copia-type
MITINLQKRLHDVRCTENGNIHTHLNNICTMQEELTSLGTVLSQPDFSAIILESLPKTYDQFLSAITATASVLKQDLNPEDLIQAIIDEYDPCLTRSRALKEKSLDIVFFAEGTNNRGRRARKKTDRDVECFNCHKKGHKKPDCWSKGGGKEGQGPRSKDRKEKGGQEGSKGGQKDLVNTSGEEDGV